MTGRPLRPAWTGPLGLHHPGTSVVHRAPAVLKLVLLAALGLGTLVVRGAVPAVGALLVVVALTAWARVPWHRAVRGLVPLLVVVALLGAWVVRARGVAAGVEAVADVLTLVLAGVLVTATTRADDLLAVVVRAARPLRRVGLDPETVGLTVGLFLATVPVLVGVVRDSRDAARARGLERDPRALVVPAAVRMVGHARATGEALAARGLGG